MANSGSTDDPEPTEKSAPVDDRMSRQLSDLQGRIERIDRNTSPDSGAAEGSAGIGRALRVGTEFVAGVAVGGFIGYWVDKAFGTRPMGFVVFFLLGIAAGFLNVIRTARRMQAEMPDVAPGADVARDDDDD